MPVQLTSEYKVVIFVVDFCGKELHYLTVIPPDHNKPICIAKPEQGEAQLLLLSDVGDGVFYVAIKVLAWVELHATTTERPDVFETDCGDAFSRVVAASAATKLAECIGETTLPPYRHQPVEA